MPIAAVMPMHQLIRPLLRWACVRSWAWAWVGWVGQASRGE